jgi:cholesterol oxidase
MLEGLAPGRARLSTLFGAAGQYLADAMSWEKGGAPVRFEADRLLQGGPTSHVLPFLGMGTDAADGKMTLDKSGRIAVDWDPDASAEMFAEMQEAMKELSQAAGGEFVPSFLYRWPARRVLTAHPLGGCAMGLNVDTGVVDHRGQVFGHPGLYVVDSAIIPGPLAVNPSATISALAERCAWWMLHGSERPLAAPVLAP